MFRIPFLGLLLFLVQLSIAQKDHQRSLIIVFDGTISMEDNLAQLKPAAKRIIDTYASREDKPIYNYVLTVFHDPGKNFVGKYFKGNRQT